MSKKGWVIFDLDNCLADDGWRIPYVDWSKTGDERYDIYHKLAPYDKMGGWPPGAMAHITAGCRIAISTARPHYIHDATLNWLSQNYAIVPDALMMRNDGDTRPSVQVKREHLEWLLHEHYGGCKLSDIKVAYDDREDVCRMYQSMGIFAVRHALHNVCAMTPPAAVQPKTAAETLLNAAQVLEDRNAIYRDNYKVVGAVMAALFPGGVALQSEEQYNAWHLFELMIVKLTRFTNSRLEHADSLDDLINYAAMIRPLIKKDLFK